MIMVVIATCVRLMVMRGAVRLMVVRRAVIVGMGVVVPGVGVPS